MTKLLYIAPLLEVFEYVVEKGFASTPVETTARTETISEINQNETNTRTIGGENYTGTWDDGIAW